MKLLKFGLMILIIASILCSCNVTYESNYKTFEELAACETKQQMIDHLTQEVKKAELYTEKVCAYVDKEPIYVYDVLVEQAISNYIIRENIVSYKEGQTFTGTDNEGDRFIYDNYYYTTDVMLEKIINKKVAMNEGKEHFEAPSQADVEKLAQEKYDSTKKHTPEYFDALYGRFSETEIMDFLCKSVITDYYANKYTATHFSLEKYKNTNERDEAFDQHCGTLWKKHKVKIIVTEWK